ncbi:YacL family protein [Bacterioplanoides sp. SCSIO 12839]|uniref:UPF0231 family protein n=1 Tax=Bacterioplanoides sp. SCSIO 12839 TaxID=2829569 RepID=UPI002106E74B|nr:YacL family protein [Bacterioplanoides sp. SCSIO 12839]UTW47470.1 YacL family protein [Bacterioplanoides sp. SCSIO 12839]
MEYQFYQGARGPVAELSMEQAAIGRWLSDEIGADTDRVNGLLHNIAEIRDGIFLELDVDGKEFRLTLNKDEVEIKANSLVNNLDADSAEQMDAEGLSFYDSEEVAGCGLDDFEALLIAWLEYCS